MYSAVLTGAEFGGRLEIGPLDIQQHVPLAPLTTMNLGGAARYFARAASSEQVLEALEFARNRRLQLWILGGGSNVIFRDEGFDGLVLRIAIRGISVREGTPTTVFAAAGEPWDDFVSLCVEYGLAGVECLSGIPGLVGGTPIQNVGAYGQEVSDCILSVTAIGRDSLNTEVIPAAACGFAYRRSAFKEEKAEKYIITGVTFGLQKGACPTVRYPELVNILERDGSGEEKRAGTRGLRAVRAAVLALRRKKSMVFDPADPNCRSVGSFFTNPVLDQQAFQQLTGRWRTAGHTEAIPTFPVGDGVKIPAAWLVENSGFPRGFRKGGAGISSNHSLAIVNCGGTTSDVLDLAADIERRVREVFAVELEREPVVVSTRRTRPS